MEIWNKLWVGVFFLNTVYRQTAANNFSAMILNKHCCTMESEIFVIADQVL